MKNQAEALCGWNEGTLKVYNRNKKRFVRPYLLKPNEISSWFSVRKILLKNGFFPTGFGIDRAQNKG